jgi:cytochrome P450
MSDIHPTESIEDRVVRFDVNDPDLQDDPYPFYAEVRQKCPIAHVRANGGHVLVTRYQDVKTITSDPARFSNGQVLIPDWEFPLGEQLPLSVDGEDHRLYRRALADLFSPAAVMRIEPRIKATAARLAADIAAKGGGEFMSEFAGPLASETFIAMFDVSPDVLPDLLHFKELLVHGGHEGRSDLKNEEAALVGFFADLRERRRAEGARGPDVMSGLLNTDFGDRKLTDDEIVNISIVLMLASLDTTSAALGNAFVWLAGHPDRRQELIDDSSLITNAVEEFLRLEGVTGTVRVVVEDTELSGFPLRKGELIMMMMGAANRDPEAFSDPDEVDFRRRPIRHMTFSAGPHRCLGMHLARRTMRAGIEEFHRAVPRYAVAPGTTPERVLGHVRGVRSLHLVVAA